MLNVLQTLTGIIQEFGTSAILRERLLLLQEQLQLLEKESVALKEENSRLKKQHEELVIQLDKHALSEQFIEKRGVLFRKTANGYSDSPFCPVCKALLRSLERSIPFLCQCGHRTLLKPMDIPKIMEELSSAK